MSCLIMGSGTSCRTISWYLPLMSPKPSRIGGSGLLVAEILSLTEVKDFACERTLTISLISRSSHSSRASTTITIGLGLSVSQMSLLRGYKMSFSNCSLTVLLVIAGSVSILSRTNCATWGFLVMSWEAIVMQNRPMCSRSRSPLLKKKLAPSSPFQQTIGRWYEKLWISQCQPCPSARKYIG
jgi:hypothetical protein